MKRHGRKPQITSAVYMERSLGNWMKDYRRAHRQKATGGVKSKVERKRSVYDSVDHYLKQHGIDLTYYSR